MYVLVAQGKLATTLLKHLPCFGTSSHFLSQSVNMMDIIEMRYLY